MTVEIRANSLGVRFMFDRQRRVVTPALARLHRRGTATWGLHDLTFSIEPGEGIALIGASGSGKTTLLRTLAGVFEPDVGTLRVNGRVASLLSIDAGLLSILTGRENVMLLGVLMGLPRRHVRAVMDEIRTESKLDDSFDRPVSSYSQGMRARLSLAVASQIQPQILLLDEVHEALDHEFRMVLESRARMILQSGGIVVAAGHDHEMLSRLCERGLWLERARLRAEGRIEEIRTAYLEGMGSDQQRAV